MPLTFRPMILRPMILRPVRPTMTSSLLSAACAGLLGLLGCTGTPGVTPTGSSGQGSGGGSGSGNPSGSGNGNGGGDIGLPPAGAGGATGSSTGTPGTTPSTDNNCGVKKVDLQKRPADLLLVLDRSRSMSQDVNGNGGNTRGDAGAPAGNSKWTEVVAAIDPVVKSTEGEVAWGLKLFPLQEQCGVPDGATVGVATGNYDKVMAAINGNDPASTSGGSTPTRLAVEKATAFMKGNASPNAKYLVVATDGQPNCASAGRNGDDADGAIAAIASAATAGIPSFVVGIATAGSAADGTLNQMAVKGGKPRNETTKYYPVASRDELVAALQSITGQIASCTFPLDQTPPVIDNVAVEVDGMRLSRDQAQGNGWNYGPNNKSIVLYGATCDRLKSGDAKNVQILFGCPGVTIN